MNARTPQRDQLITLLEPVVTSAGYDLEDVSITAAGRRSLIRVLVDGDDGIDLDAVAELARGVSQLLDEETDGGPAFAGPYVLEVSSPGVDRPLTEPRHWRRAVGRLVSVTTADGEAITGRVLSADGDSVTFDLDGSARVLTFASAGPGRVQVEFSRPGERWSDSEEDDSEVDGYPEVALDAVAASAVLDKEA
jgi:ribosome maturation factor RimP